MALNYGAAALHSKPSPPKPWVPKHKHLYYSSSHSPIGVNQHSSRVAAQPEGTERGVAEEDPRGLTGMIYALVFLFVCLISQSYSVYIFMFHLYL